MDIFSYDSLNKQLEINTPEVLLIKEFKALLDRDKTKHKTKAFKEFTYIYLAISWKSPYNQYSEYERHEEALLDSELTEEQFNDPLFREACRKFRNLQESNKSIKLLNAARNAADQFVEYFETIIDLNERDQNGKPVFSAEKVMKEMGQLSKVHEQLQMLEAQVKQEMEVSAGTRANVEKGFDPGEF